LLYLYLFTVLHDESSSNLNFSKQKATVRLQECERGRRNISFAPFPPFFYKQKLKMK